MSEESEAMLEVISGQLERLDDVVSNLAAISKTLAAIEESLQLLVKMERASARREGVDLGKALEEVGDKEAVRQGAGRD